MLLLRSIFPVLTTASTATIDTNNHQKPLKLSFLCIPLMNLSTCLREWHALHSIHSHYLMPLAPHLLKASPVISLTQLTTFRDQIMMKEKLLKAAYLTKATSARIEQLITALLSDLLNLTSYKIDSSVLKNSQIVSQLKTLLKCNYIPIEAKRMITQQLGSWKESIIEESKVTKITNSKGGKVVEIPLEFPKPKELSNLLWNTLQSRYNSSQLYAIYHVISQHQSSQVKMFDCILKFIQKIKYINNELHIPTIEDIIIIIITSSLFLLLCRYFYFFTFFL